MHAKWKTQDNYAVISRFGSFDKQRIQTRGCHNFGLADVHSRNHKGPDVNDNDGDPLDSLIHRIQQHPENIVLDPPSCKD